MPLAMVSRFQVQIRAIAAYASVDDHEFLARNAK